MLIIFAQVYSNGLSEVMLGKAIKQLSLPREEIVVMTKVFGVLAPQYDMNLMAMGLKADEVGLINQHGLSRKVRLLLAAICLMRY